MTGRCARYRPTVIIKIDEMVGIAYINGGTIICVFSYCSLSFLVLISLNNVMN